MPSVPIARILHRGTYLPPRPLPYGSSRRGPGSGRGFPSGRRAGASATRIASTGDRFAESQSGESKAWTRTLRMAVSAPAQSRSHGVWFVREAFRPDDRTATEVSRPVPFKKVSAYEAEPERWSWIRTSDTMIINHLLYPSELSSFARPTGFEPAACGFPRRSHLTELRTPLFTSAEHETRRARRAGRDKSPNPGPKRRSGVMIPCPAKCKRKMQPAVAIGGRAVARWTQRRLGPVAER